MSGIRLLLNVSRVSLLKVSVKIAILGVGHDDSVYQFLVDGHLV